MTRVAVIGSRGIGKADQARVAAYIAKLPRDTVVVTGDAAGVDLAVREAAKGRLVTVIVRPAWDAHGKAAGPIRNGVLVALSERVVAFWDGRSKGTASAVEAAEKLGLPVEVVTVGGV